jgi:uncharacterized membrane protein HdeD (DUF308 family)
MSKEGFGGILFFAAGLYGGIFSISLPLGQWNQPGPAVFPLALSMLLCLFGVSWVIRGISLKGGLPQSRGGRKKWGVPLQITGLTAGFILILNPLGYLGASTLYLFILFYWVSRYKLWNAVVLAVMFGTGSWLFFSRLLAASLPPGFLSL